MRVSVQQLSKDLLSGGSAEISTEEAIIIPIDSKTTLASTKKQIDKLFDRVESIITGKEAKVKARVSHRATYRKAVARNADAIGSVVGIAAAAAYHLMAGDLRKRAAGIYNSIAETANVVYDSVKNTLLKAIEWSSTRIEDLSKNAVAMFTSKVSPFFELVKTKFKGIFSTDKSKEVAQEYAVLVDNPRSVIERMSEAPNDAKRSRDSIGVSLFTSVVKTVKGWLYRILALLKGENLESGSDGSSRSASGGGSAGVGGSYSPSSATGKSSIRKEATGKAKVESGFYPRVAPSGPIPGTDIPSTGRQSVDNKIAKMNPEERKTYIASGKKDIDVHNDTWTDASPRMFNTGSFVPQKPKGEDQLARFSPYKASEEEKTKQAAFAYQTLKDSGYTNRMAAISMANMMGESQFDPKAVHFNDRPKAEPIPTGIVINGRALTRRDSVGAFQMNDDRQVQLVEYAKKHGLDPLSLKAQIGAHAAEVAPGGTEEKSGQFLRESRGEIGQDALAFGKMYERFSGSGGPRDAYARSIMKNIESGKYNSYDFSGKTAPYHGGRIPLNSQPPEKVQVKTTSTFGSQDPKSAKDWFASKVEVQKDTSVTPVRKTTKEDESTTPKEKADDKETKHDHSEAHDGSTTRHAMHRHRRLGMLVITPERYA